MRFCWLRANLYDPWSRGSQFDARLNLGNRNGLSWHYMDMDGIINIIQGNLGNKTFGYCFAGK